MRKVRHGDNDWFTARAARWQLRLETDAEERHEIGVSTATSQMAAAAAGSPLTLAGARLNPQPAAGDLFGIDVAWVDGLVAVGTARDTVNGVARAGAVHLLAGPGGPFGTPVLTLQSPLPTQDAWFGSSLAVAGAKLVVGSSDAGIPMFRPGVAYVYDADQTSAGFGGLIATLRNPRASNGDKFGFDVATLGDHAIVGAYADGTLAPATGAAYMFDINPSSADFGKLIHTFENPTPQAGDLFGVQAVGVGGDKVLIGAFRDDTAGVDAGAAHLFDADPASATFGALLHTFVNPRPSPTRPNGTNDEFGHFLASSGDYVFISSFREDVNGQSASGAVYMFDADPASATFGDLLKTFEPPVPQAGANFGFSVKTRGTELLIGAWREDGTQLDSGALYHFDADPASPEFGQLIDQHVTPLGVAYEQFGSSIAAGPDGILVGALGTLFVGGVYFYT